MAIIKFLNRFFDARKNGRLDEIKQDFAQYRISRKNNDIIKVKRIEKKFRSIVSKCTCGNLFASHIASFITPLLCSSASEEELERIIKVHVSEKKWQDKVWLKHIKKDIYFTEFFNRVNADEYFRYQFEMLSKAGRHSYVGDAESTSQFRKLDDPLESKILQNKYNTYCFFKPYYKREAICLNDFTDKHKFFDFCLRNSEFVVKPLSDGGGHGVCFFKLKTDEDKEELFKKIIEQGSVIVEELIHQAYEMAKYHPDSINTIRVVTVQKGDNVEIIQTSVRLGVGDSRVDNGCLSAAVNTEAGIIISQGRTAHQKGLYLKHPDTGEQILGNQIPEWENLITLVRLLASNFKKQRIIGWDMAYSVNGWVIVEANSHPSIQTLAGNGVGMRDIFEKIIK